MIVTPQKQEIKGLCDNILSCTFKLTFDLIIHYNKYIPQNTTLMSSNRTYYINQIKDLSTNFDDDTASKIISEMKNNIFDFKGLKKLYDLLMEDVYGDNGIKGY